MSNPYVDGLAPPMLAREVRLLPKGEDWMYEFLWGGERMRGIKYHGEVRLISRDGKDFTERFPRIVAAVSRLRNSNAIVDGEIVYLGSYPKPVIRFLSESMDEFYTGGLAFIAYDLLRDEGTDVRPFSLLCRRLLLASTVQGTPIVLSPLIDGRSETAIAASARLGFRGILAKRAGSAYVHSLSDNWVKRTFAVPASASAYRGRIGPAMI